MGDDNCSVDRMSESSHAYALTIRRGCGMHICIYLAGSCQSNVHARIASGPVLAAIASGEDVPLERYSEASGILSLSAATKYASRVRRPVVGGHTISVHRVPRLSNTSVTKISEEINPQKPFLLFFLLSDFEKFHLFKISPLEKFPLKYLFMKIVFSSLKLL